MIAVIATTPCGGAVPLSRAPEDRLARQAAPRLDGALAPDRRSVPERRAA